VELPTGAVLVTEQSTGEVTDVSSGGDLTSATPFASGLLYVRDLAVTSGNRLFVSGSAGTIGVYDISAGGDFGSATPYAWGKNFFGLAVDAGNRLLAIPQNGNQVFDITAGGDFTSAAAFAYNLPIVGETPLDTVPSTTTVTLDVPGNLLIADTAAGGKDDRLTLSKVGTLIQITDLDGRPIYAGSVPGATGSGTATVTIPDASFTGEVRVSTHAGNDTLTVDLSSGNPVPAGGLTFHGGAGGNDDLTVERGSVTNFTYPPFDPAGPDGPGSGEFDIDGRTIKFTGLEPTLVALSAANVTIDMSSLGAGEDVTVGDTGTATPRPRMRRSRPTTARLISWPVPGWASSATPTRTPTPVPTLTGTIPLGPRRTTKTGSAFPPAAGRTGSAAVRFRLPSRAVPDD